MAKATGSNKQRKNPMQLGGFLSQVMLRVALVLGLALVLVSIVSAVLLINRTRSEVADQSEIAVSSLAARFARELDEPINELVRAAISATAREYAQTISQLGPNADFEAALSTTQRDLLRNFDDVVRGGSSRIIAVRYIGRDGQLWGQVISRGDETEVTPRVNASLLGAPGLADALTEGVAGQPFLSDVVEVPDTQQTLLYVYVPVATTGNTLNTLGVVQMIVNIDLLDALADDLLNDPLVAQDGREMLVVDNNNRVIAASDAALVNDQGVLAFLAANDGEYVLRSQDDLRISTRVIEDYEGVGTPWRIVMVDQDRLLIQPTIQVIVAVFAFFTGVYIAAMSLIGVLLRPVSRMLRKVSVSAQQLAELDAQSEDEIATLDMAVQRLSARLETLNTTLEIEASRRTRDLELAARIGREVATLYDVDTLVNRAINLIADELGFYHAQVFLVDEAGVNAVLAYSRGAAGRTLLAQRFAIPVGSKTVIGTVTGSGTPVIVNDTQQGDAPHGFNPVLAETRAEIGLPLFSRDRVIGVLDIQSKTAGVFHTADLATYQLLADQLAIALENARLISQTDRRVQQIDILNRQLTRSAWEGIENREDLERGYRYNLLDIEPVEPGPGSNGHERALRSPITIRGEVIGELAALSDDVEFTEGDRVIVDSIAGRVALAIENARLFQETQNSLMETSTLYQLSRYLNEANTLEDIIQAIIVSIMPEASGGQVWMFEEATDDIDEHEWLVISADLAVETREANNENLHGLRLHAPDHVFLRDFNRDGITLINETRVDTRLDTGLKLIFRRLLAEAVVLIPLVVRGEWRGILSMTFATARQFSEREARVYSALSDQAAVAVDNRMLLRQTEQEVARNETLYAASRLINTAETMQDLVYAAVATSTADAALDFSLSLLEGELDAQGWPTRARLVAYSSGVNVVEDSAEFTFFTPEDSPMRSRNPEIIVDDTPSNNNVSPRVHWIREQGYRFMAIFPLFSANQPIALFHIASAELYELTASDYEFYRALTGQMSSQIQVRKLLERTELALDETRRLYVASNAIISAQDARSIYQLAIEHLARPFVSMHEGKRIYEISLLMAWPEVSADAPYLEYVHRWRSDSGTPFGYTLPVRVPMQEMPFNELTEDAASVMLFDDITSDSEANAPLRANRYLLTRMRRSGAVSMLVAPIRRGRDRWFGVLVCHANTPGAFDEQYSRFAMALSDQIAVAVDNFRLVDQARFEASRAQTEAQRALALAEAAQLSSRIGGEDLIGALGVVFRRVAEVAGFDRWMMLRQREDQPGSMDVLLVQGPEGVPHRRDTVSLNTPLPYATSIRQGQALLFNQTEEQALLEGDEAYAKAYVQQWGKHIATPIVIGTHTIGGILMGRHLDGKDVDERDQQLIETLASQVAVALENRRLFEQAQSEQRTLRLILETLPAGVLVLDAYTLKPVQFNDQASALLRKEINLDEQFSVEAFNLYRTGTQLFYPEQELPISIALATGQEASTDDIAIITDKIQTDLLMNAAPITDRDGQVSSIVVAMQDITSLRSLENTLQENLRETVSLYEAQRQVAEAGDLDEVLDVMLTHLILQQPLDTFILTADRAGYLSVARSYLSEPEEPDVLLPLLDEQETVVIWDLASVEYDADARGALHAMGASAAIILPINVSMEKLPFGWIVVLTDSVDMAGADQERIYTQLRDVVATAIDNRLLIDSQQAALSEVRSLYNATNAISRARDIDQITEALAEAIQVFEADYVFGYLAEDAGLQSGEIMLFDQQADDAAVDFRAIMAGYDIPPGGVYINDLMRISERVETEEHLLRAGIRSFAAVTLRPKDMSSGLLLIAYREPHLFTEAEDRYLNTLADGASVVFNTFVLFDQIQSALEETSTLYQASRALSDATSAEEILDVVVNYLIAPHVNQVFIALMQSGDDWSDPAAVVEVAASWSEDDSIDLSGLTLMRSQFPIWDFLASPTVVTVDDIYGDPRLDEATRSGVESLQVRSLVVVPLRVAKRAIGAVWLGSSMPHIHDDRERRTFQAFAEQASLSLEAAYLLSQTERRARQLQTSAEVSQSASQILDLEELMPRLVSLIKDAFGYDHVQIFLMDEANEYAELRASTGEAGRQLLAIHHKLKRGSDSVIGMVTQTGQPQIALDTAEAGVVHRPNQYLPLTRSEMALPLIIKGQVVGALDVQSNQPNAFIEEDIKALTTLAAQIAVAIDNANLYEAAQNQVNRMSFLFEITSTAAAGESLEDSFQRIAERLHETLEPLSVVAYQPQVYVDERDEDIEFAALKAVAQAGLAQPLTEIEEVRLDDTQKLMAEVAVSRQAFVIDDIEKEARYLPIAQHARSAVLVPMVASGELVGLLVMEDDRPTAYGPDTLQLLLTMSGSLSAIVQSIQLLDQLQRTNEQLRELDRLKSDFLANMSHELRTPLNSIIGFSRVMLKGIDGPLTEMQEQDLTTIYNSGQHLLMLINDILDQAKIAAEKLDLKFDYFEVKPLAEGVRSIGIGLVKDKVVDLRLEMAPNMPRVYGDEFRTRQILLNLVSNAAKFTQEGTITIKVYPIVQEDGLTMVRFDVADTGIGIAEKDLPLLFEAFRQVDSSLTRTQGGTGLGLPIAKSLAELQGGEMTVASTVNVGSTFSFTIPTEPVVDENGEDIEGDADLSGTLDEDTMVASVTGPNGKDVDAAARPSDDDTLQIKKETRQIEVKSVRTAMEASKVVTQVKRDVLLIEENKDMVDQFRRTLQREGYEVFTADHPSYAEAMAGNLRPTAIVMDVNFANGEGWNLLARLKDRDDTFDIPIVVVTLSNESERAYQTGAYHFIQRPFVPEDLAAAVLNAEKEHAVDRILIIDDDEEAVRLLTQLLNDAGQYRVFAARNAAEGISLVARRRPNLIILDLRMPEKDGFAVLEELRNNPETASIPVLVVTGEMNLNAEEQARLHDVRVLQKTAISQEEHDAFIRDVQAYLNSDRE